MKTMPAGQFKARCLNIMDQVVKPITAEIAAIATQFPDDYPRDPAGRLIGATAMAEGLALVTRDDRIRSSRARLTTVW